MQDPITLDINFLKKTYYLGSYFTNTYMTIKTMLLCIKNSNES